MEEWDEAVEDYGAAAAIDPAGFQVGQKLKYAQQKQKAARKKDYYKILGVAKDAPEKTIKTAYRKAALKWHPDKNNETPEQKTRAEKMFKEVNEAWAVLQDPQKRQQHDMGMSMDDMN
jgi:preprotein translocase subunit Sec63